MRKRIDIGEVRRLYWDEGLSQREIARRIGMSESAVRNAMRRHGVPSRTKAAQTYVGILDERRDEVLRLRYGEWLTHAEIGERIGVPMASVQEWFTNRGLDMGEYGEEVRVLRRRMASKSPFKRRRYEAEWDRVRAEVVEHLGIRDIVEAI